MAMLTLDSTSETNISKTLPFRTSSNFRDASFSSYLSGAEEAFVVQLAESSKNCKSLISTTPFEHLHLVSKKVDDTEIDIFSADKYFNEGLDEESPRLVKNYSKKLDQKVDPPPELDPVKHQTRSGTPSILSESSWNSQNPLLHNIPRTQQPQKTNKVSRRSFLANIGCNCYCSDKNSVNIDIPIGENSSNRSLNGRQDHGKARKPTKDIDAVSLNESRSHPWIKEDLHGGKFDQLGIGLSTKDHLRFPVCNPKSGDNVLELQRKEEEDDTWRKSLEVYGSPTQRKGEKSMSRERSLNMMTWDAIVPKLEDNPSSFSGIYNDTDSDASSDLFEIESFSTNPSQHLTRQASTNSITQTNCYAPSEVSIEWSVVTASAADYSVMSDSEDLRTTSGSKANPRGLNGRTSPGRETPKRRTGILSGCYSQKAVKVAGDVYRTSAKTSPSRHQKPEFLMPMTRFHAENELARFDTKRNGHFSYDTRLLTCSKSGRVMDPLYKH